MCRKQCEQALSGLFRRACDGDVRSFKLLSMFLKCILAPPPRGSAKNPAKLAAMILRRLSLWHGGQFRALWDSIPPAAPPSTRVTTPLAKATGALKLVREGLFSRALNRLMSDGTLTDTPEVLERLSKLHPKSDVDLTDTAAEVEKIAEDLELTEDDVITSICSFDRMTASGAMGLKASVLRSLIAVDETKTLARAITRFVTFCAAGHVPMEIRPYLAGACLTALPKPDGGARPIAAGEILRRIVAKTLAKKAIPQVAASFMPYQYGVGVKQGCERIAHQLRRLLEINKNNPDFVGVKVDMANAFNRMARQQMILAVNNAPGLARWVVVCMAQHSVLWFGSSRLSSEEGGQQGDPLIPLLFALVLHPLIKKIEKLGPTANLWFVDDGTIWGSHKVVAEALALLDGPDEQRTSESI